MSAPVLTSATVALCPHGAALTLLATTQRVLIGGAPVLTLDATGLVNGCAIPPPDTCRTAHWLTGSARVLAQGRPVLLQSNPGQCRTASGAPAGPVIVAQAGTRVLAL